MSTVSAAELACRVRRTTGLRLEPVFTKEILHDWRARGIAEERLLDAREVAARLDVLQRRVAELEHPLGLLTGVLA